MELSEITPVAQDYLKVIWAAIEWGGPPITATALAARMGTTMPNVSDTVRRLAAQGLVEYQPYKPVMLTEQGEKYAIAMVRRHRLLETFLATILDYPWEEVHNEAERLEHAASDTLIERIDAFLGNPTVDPHGDPIPTTAGHISRSLDATLLTHATPGNYEIIRISDADPAQLTYFRKQEIVPGALVNVAAADPHQDRILIKDADGKVVLLTPEQADAIWVAPS
ncbi:metal-dependent transcriptional regulator [Corynebacterium hylobatis]|uniref:Diphtheria toxin repressor n=1 Tax=Corynebacterium hylobatis TaxID=1859290 RepID=A0A430HUY5_9CORY|nr:metal-dependent transcriptional regulator [Corynebacterium hylobatis]RSZ61292.1 metal-dependent transcriptional regulator [Corynebacterium hylobatis]